MRASNLIVIALAAVFGLLSIFAGRSWLTRQADAKARQLEAAAQRAPVSTRKMVVAAQPLRFGSKLDAGMLREIDWPAGELPTGAFAGIADVFARSGDRIVLTAMDPNEPLLSFKITAPGERATLSRMLREGMKAVTIQANAVAGVGGFVNPGDHVDVILTRSASENTAPTASVILQNVRVLAVDQNADDRKFKATVAQTVTLEVPIKQAQRIVLAAAVGTMSLVLRSAGDTDENAPERVSLTDLGLAPADPAPSAKTDTPAVASAPAPPPAAPAPVTRSLMPAAAPASPPPTSAWSLSSIFGTTPGAPVAKPAPEPKTVVIGVARGVDRKEYRVPAADASGAAIRPAGAAAN